jgi:hypothetical protein
MTTSPTPQEICERIGHIAMEEFVCGLTIDGQHVFCDHPKAQEKVSECACRAIGVKSAATIAQLLRENEGMREALKPFARLAEAFPEAAPPEFRLCGRQLTLLGKSAEFRDITLGDLRRARLALTGIKAEDSP